MSTVEDFENAPIGATASNPRGATFRREKKTAVGADWAFETTTGSKIWGHSEDLPAFGYVLGPLPPSAPTTAREALDLAWNLAHPVKEGRVIPEGTACLARFDDGYQSYETPGELITSENRTDIRTLDPLPEPEPDWLDAPAVLARVEDPEPHVWVNIGERGWRDANGNTRRWTTLRDVTPLYPKETK